MKILFHGDGDSQKGLGHLVRCLGTAMEMLFREKKIEGTFATSNPKVAGKIFKQFQSFFPVEPSRLPIFPIVVPEGANWKNSASLVLSTLRDLVEKKDFEALVSDGKYVWAVDEITDFQKTCPLILIDNACAGAAIAERVIFPVDHALPEHTDNIPAKNLRMGMDWTWLHPAVKSLKKSHSPQIEVAVSMGGADPHRLTLLAMDRIEESNRFQSATVVVGEAFGHKSEIEARVKNSSKVRWTMMLGGKSAHEAFANSRGVVSAFGITAYECYFLGIPTIIAGHDRENSADAREFLKKHPDAGVFTDLKSLLPHFDTLKPNPPPKMGELAVQLQSALKDIVGKF